MYMYFIITFLNNLKSVGDDEITVKLLKYDAAHIIVQPLTIIINMKLRKGIFP